jgi:hypothetical protein
MLLVSHNASKKASLKRRQRAKRRRDEQLANEAREFHRITSQLLSEYQHESRTLELVNEWAKNAKAQLVAEAHFEELANQWEQETRHLSSPIAIAKHPACEHIVEMGPIIVVPLILHRMKTRPWFWFEPLMKLTRETIDPVKPSMYGNLQQMTDAWLEWGIGRGYTT